MGAAAYCDVAVPLPLHETFTYRIPPELAGQVCVGARVVVPFRQRKLLGVVTALAEQPRVAGKLKDVLEVVDTEPLLLGSLLDLARWITEYYLAPPGEVFRVMLPLHGEFAQRERARLRPLGVERLAELERKESRSEGEQAEYELLRLLGDGKPRNVARLARRVPEGQRRLARLRRQGWLEVVRELRRRRPRPAPAAPLLFEGDWSGGPAPVLTGEQERALEEIERLLAPPSAGLAAGRFATVLLQGVTGSGKTEVYSRAIQACLERDRTALLLVPEIALTPAVAELFAARFGDRVAVLHSGLTPRERSTEWWRLRRGEARIVVGTRSAVFAPVENLGVVIVDEEQDSSYKQEETPRYHGRDTAVVRAKREGAVVVLGSATPALETSYHARSGRYQRVQLESRVGDRPLATVHVVDMRAEFQETKKAALFSRALTSGMECALGERGQVLVLLNRRGYANFLLCRKCGATVQCAHCSISLTFHRARGRLLCHYCGFARHVPKLCEKCGSEHVHYVGEGAEQVEEAVRSVFPTARVARLDRDIPQRGTARPAERILRQFVRGQLDILVGTQMIAKGHDFQGVTLVGVVSADVILGLPDFRAAERTFQLLTQVAGRAGRGPWPGQVIVQTYYPDHYAIRFGAAQDYEGFYEQELRFRRLLHYPPFTALANLVVRDRRLDAAVRVARQVQEFFSRQAGRPEASGLRVLGPAPAPLARLKRDYRFQFLLKSPDRRALQETLRAVVAFARKQQIPAGSLVVDVDPISLL